MLKDNNNQLLKEIEKLKKKCEKREKNIALNTIKESENENGEEFLKLFKGFVDKIMLKNKVKLYLNMMVTQKMEDLIIENNKLNNEKNELNDRVIFLTELLNNPENIAKYIDEDGNINLNIEEEHHYENENNEDINYENNNNFKDNQNINYDINDNNINYMNNQNINYENIDIEEEEMIENLKEKDNQNEDEK